MSSRGISTCLFCGSRSQHLLGYWRWVAWPSLWLSHPRPPCDLALCSGSSSEAFQKGGRKGAKKVMIVITDGESHDSPDLDRVIQQSEKDNVTRYAVAVSPARLPCSPPPPACCQLPWRGSAIKPLRTLGGIFWAVNKLSKPSEGPLVVSSAT